MGNLAFRPLCNSDLESVIKGVFGNPPIQILRCEDVLVRHAGLDSSAFHSITLVAYVVCTK